jgi:hypothetical protein
VEEEAMELLVVILFLILIMEVIDKEEKVDKRTEMMI